MTLLMCEFKFSSVVIIAKLFDLVSDGKGLEPCSEHCNFYLVSVQLWEVL